MLPYAMNDTSMIMSVWLKLYRFSGLMSSNLLFFWHMAPAYIEYPLICVVFFCFSKKKNSIFFLIVFLWRDSRRALISFDWSTSLATAKWMIVTLDAPAPSEQVQRNDFQAFIPAKLSPGPRSALLPNWSSSIRFFFTLAPRSYFLFPGLHRWMCRGASKDLAPDMFLSATEMAAEGYVLRLTQWRLSMPRPIISCSQY